LNEDEDFRLLDRKEIADGSGEDSIKTDSEIDDD
jgi:hypothetical protein